MNLGVMLKFYMIYEYKGEILLKYLLQNSKAMHTVTLILLFGLKFSFNSHDPVGLGMGHNMWSKLFWAILKEGNFILKII